jgi:hypothetical protein
MDSSIPFQEARMSGQTNKGMKKAPFEEIVERFSRIAAEKALDEEILTTLIKKARRELNRELYGS